MSSKINIVLKLIFDYALACLLLTMLFPIGLVLFILCSFSTNENGFFTQKRIGKNGKHFKVIKFKTMRSTKSDNSSIASLNASRITQFGQFMRKFKLDELPQLFNILKGDMSFVGPRPDVQGYADQLEGEDRIILSILPGITGPAQIYFKDEEEILNKVSDPVKYNDEVIWPKKIELNKNYVKNWSFRKDFYYLFKTVFA